MISNLPNPEKLTNDSRALLVSAWEVSLKISMECSVLASKLNLDDQTFAGESYWVKTRMQLLTAFQSVWQAVSFLLQAKVSEISPLLLVDISPTQWQAIDNGTGFSFSDFESIPPTTLVTVCECAANLKFSAQFKDDWKMLCSLSPVLPQQNEKMTWLTPARLVEIVLRVSNFFFGKRQWHKIRSEYYYSKMRLLLADGSDFNESCELAVETSHVLQGLNLVEDLIAESYIYAPSKDLLLCPGCSDLERGLKIFLAQPEVGPSIAEPTVYCVSCQTSFLVAAARCDNEGCSGVVVAPEWDCLCLKCGLAVDLPYDDDDDDDDDE